MKKNILISIGALAALLLAGWWMSTLTPSTTVKRLSGPTFLSAYHATPSAVLLDVRTPAEFAEGHIDGAKNIDFESGHFLADLAALDRSTPYFLYCRSGNRSGQAVALMQKEGFTHLVDLSGGVVGNTTSLRLVTTMATSGAEYTVDASDLLPAPTPTAVSAELLSAEEKRGLLQMREEEKLARDVYRTLGSQWDLRIFENIAASEQTHTTAVGTLLARYGVADPVRDDTVGAFTDPTMKKLYGDLVARGSTSEVEALTVGALIEDLDISDLEVFMKGTSKADILSVYANLQKGSRNHLRGFTRTLGMRGVSYTPSYISAAAYQEIIAAPQERGMR